MKIIFTGGGTLGHVIPALTVAHTLEKQKRDNIELFYIGQKSSVEERYLKEKFPNIPFISIVAGKYRRYFDIKNLFDPIFVIIGFFQSLYHLGKIKPDLVFSKGGFVAVPVCYAARILRIPVLVHESDLTIGLANRLTGYVADKILTTFPIDSSDKYVHVGLPINEEILHARSSNLSESIDQTKPVLMFVGGSSGAVFVNDLVWKNLQTITNIANVIHIYVNGDVPAGDYKNYFPYKRVDQMTMGGLYKISDIVVGRCGATTLFETATLYKPMFAMPLPYSNSRGDQIENAKFFEKSEAIEWVDQDSESIDNILAKLISFIGDKEKQKVIKGNLVKFDSSNATTKIIDIINTYEKR